MKCVECLSSLSFTLSLVFFLVTLRSHVTMSVTKLLARIVAPSEIESDNDQVLHDHSYGITSDPLVQFGTVFAALIHDVDHSGVPNAQLVKEKARIAEFYKGQSVAEQNSVDLAWNLLMDDKYEDLRQVIYRSDDEYARFRHLVVNSVMATDIVDKELKAMRDARWEKAFSEDTTDESTSVAVNRKATIVIEHLIQASDVAHTMQHWHVYRRWNEVRKYTVAYATALFLQKRMDGSNACISCFSSCSVSLSSATKITLSRGLKLTRQSIGIRERWAFSTFTSFHWPRSSRTVESSASVATNICCMPEKIERNGRPGAKRLWQKCSRAQRRPCRYPSHRQRYLMCNH